MKSERIVYLDVIRVLSCMMIVLMHSPREIVPGYVQVPLYFLTSAGLVLFFMVSGALLLPVKGEHKGVVQRRMGKILGPTLFWTLIYLIVNVVEDAQAKEHIVRDLISIPFTAKGTGVLWFMYTLAGLYLLAPILSSWIEKATHAELRFYLLLWGVGLSFPFIALVADVNTSTTGILYYFIGYVGYFLFGYYLHNYGIRLSLWAIPLLIALPLIGLILYKVTVDGEMGTLFSYLSIPVAVMALAWFEAFRRSSISKRLGGAFLTEFSNCSFGIYLMHILIMRHFLWKIDFVIYGLGWIGQLAMTWVLTLVISFLLTKAISYLPYSEYIIGYHTKRNK